MSESQGALRAPYISDTDGTHHFFINAAGLYSLFLSTTQMQPQLIWFSVDYLFIIRLLSSYHPDHGRLL